MMIGPEVQEKKINYKDGIGSRWNNGCPRSFSETRDIRKG
jgi:hypothetical protein